MAVVEAILSQVVSSGTRKNYANHNADLILWIYDKDEWVEKDLHKYAVIRYPCLSTNYTPYATGIPPYFMLMAEIEALKAAFKKQITHIVEDMRT